MKYRIESSCALTGAYQWTTVVDSLDAVKDYCTAEWRAESIHVVSLLNPYQLAAWPCAVYVAGLKIYPRFISA